MYEKRPLTKSEWEDLTPRGRGDSTGFLSRIILNKGLKESQQPMVLAHEVGHGINDVAGVDRTRVLTKAGRKIPFGEIPVTGKMPEEMRQVYSDLNGGLSPQSFRYKGDEVRSEFMAEAIRAYMADPNYFKTVAPETAAVIRKAVNANPRLSRSYNLTPSAAWALAPS